MAAENFKVKKGLEVGTGITANSDGVNVTGIITATQFKGDGSGLTGVVGSGSGIVVKDEGSAVGTAGTVNFVGSGVAATLSAGTATVTINAGGLDNVVEDTTPQLGGNLDLNSKFVTGSGGINVTGVVTATTLKGNGDFVDIDVDGQTEVDDLRVAGVSTFIGSLQGSVGAFTGNVSGNQGTFSGNITGPLLSISPGSGDDGIILLNSAGGQNNDFSRIRQVVSDDSFRIENKASGSYESLLRGTGGAGVKLYFAGNEKLTTTINGIEVPDLNATGVGTVGRLDTSGVTLGTNATTFAAKFLDDAVINVGTNNDLKIYHDDGNGLTYIRQDGTGPLDIRSINDINIRDGNDGDLFIKCEESEGVSLHYEGAEKLITDVAGVKITGVVTATTFSGSGASLTNLPSAQLTGALPALDGSALTGVTGSGSGIIVRHDGNVVGTASSINFSTNLDVSAISAGIVTVTASGGGVSLSGSTNNTVATVTGANALIGEANLTFDGNTLNITDGGSGDQKILLFGTNPLIRFKEGSTNKGYIQWHSSGYLRLTNEEDGSQLRIKDDIQFSLDGTTFHKVWHAGNDGASSGLDADLLDGQEGSYYTNSANLTGTIAAISGANLTTLNASELDSGTIPNGRFPTTLPAVGGGSLTDLNASALTTGTIPTARFGSNNISPSSISVTSSRILGRVSSGTNSAEELTAAQVRTLLNVADGATAGITTAPSNVVLTWDVVNQSASAYRFTGPGQDGSSNNPDIYLVRGNKYRFALNASGHPFQIRVSNGGSAYNDGVTNNGAQTGNVEFYVQNDAPASLVYQCTSHGGMVGNIYITGHQLTNGADNRVVTATSAYGMNGESGLTYNGSLLGVTGDIAVSTTNRVYFGNSDVAWVKGVHGSSGYLELGVNTAHVRLTRGGEVGIGTDDPVSQLNLKLASRTSGFRITDSNTTADCLRAGAQSDGDGFLQLRTTSGAGPVLFDASGISYVAGGNFVVGGTSAQASDAVTLMTDGEVTAAGFYFSNNIGSPMNSDGFRRHTTGTICIDTASQERLRITSAGRVGIGTDNPSEVLHVLQSGTTAAEFRLENNEGYLLLRADSNVATYGAEQHIFHNRANDTEYLRITSDGVIGINDNNPGTGKKVKVVVANNSSYQMAVNLTNNVNADINFYIKTNESLIAPSTNTPLCLGTGGAEKLRIRADGDTTISASASANFFPGAALDIVSDKNVENGIDDKANYHLALANPNNDTGEAIGIAFGITDTSTKVGAAIVHERDAAGSQGSLKFFTRPNNGGPPVERLKINSDGHLFAPSLNSGSGHNDVRWVSSTGQFIYNASTRLLKTDIEDCSYGLAEIKQLKPRIYKRIDADNVVEIGLIADEVQPILPEIVVTEKKSFFTKNESDTEIIPSNWDSKCLTAILIKAIQEQQEQIETLKSKVAALEGS